MIILYLRKSTESEDRQVRSLESQLDVLSEIAEKEGLVIDKIFKENKSAKAPGRPEFNKMIKLIEKNPGATVLVWKLDRLARNSVDDGMIKWLLQNQVIKIIITPDRKYSPEDNSLITSVEFGMANQYLKDLSSNVKRGLKTKLSNGEWIRKAPVGYKNEKQNHTVVIDKNKSKYIVKMFEMFSTGSYTIKQIAETLFQEGFRTDGGYKIHKGSVYHILNNPFYAGTMRVKGALYPGKHLPLISQTLFDTCQRVFSPNRSRKQRHNFLLTGKMSCAECGCALTATIKKGYTYYYCTNGKRVCSQHKTYMRSEIAEELIARVFGQIRVDKEIIEIMYLAAKEKLTDQNTYEDFAKDSLLNELKMLLERKNRLEDMYLNGVMELDRYKSKQQEYINEEVSLKNKISQLKTTDTLATLEQTKKAFLTAHNAEKDFLCADDFKKSELVKTLLWNASIKDKQVQRFQLKQPFQLMAEAPKTNDISLWLG